MPRHDPAGILWWLGTNSSHGSGLHSGLGHTTCLSLNFVIQEAMGSDQAAAQEMLACIQNMPRLAVTDEAGEQADKLIERGHIPEVPGRYPPYCRVPCSRS